LASSGKKRNKAVLLVGLLLLVAGLAFAFFPAGAGVAGWLMRLWPVFLICAGVVRVMGFVVERKPRSPMGGTFLIIIGVLFLASRFHSDLNALQVYGRYWLVLLVVFATVELLKFYSHRPTDGYPPKLFTFWRVSFVILIVSTGVLAHRVAGNNPSMLSALKLDGLLGGLRDSVVGQEYKFTDPVYMTSNLTSDSKVEIVNSYGNVKVTGGDGPSVRATLSKGVRAWSEDDAREIADQIKLVVNQTPNGLQITTNRDQVNQQFTTDIQLEIPSSLLLSITGSYGAVSVNGMDNNLAIKASYGKAQVGDISGDVKLDLSYSDVEVSNIDGFLAITGAKRAQVSDVDGGVDLQASNSNVDLRGIRGSVKLDAPFCRITAQDLESGGELKTEHGNVKVIRSADINIYAPKSDVRAESIRDGLRVSSSNSDIVLRLIEGEAVITAQQSSVTADEVHGPIEIATSHGGVTIKNFRDTVRVQTSYRDVSLVAANEPTRDIEVENSHGEIKLSIPDSSRFQLDAVSENGQVKQTGFNSTGQKPLDRLLAVFGLDGPRIKLRTSYKDISIQASRSRQAQTRKLVS
jgi:DUF4097 and DUF4098 domain-containing protein YvlB/uncharacterized membrane protein HdeD (DUF308 family)